MEDVDGDFLLIEAARELPDWMDPSTMDNRFFLANGHFYILPHHQFSAFKHIPVHPSVEEAIALLPAIPCQASPPIEAAIMKRLRHAAASVRSNTHRFYCSLPSSWAKLVATPSVLTLFSRLLVESTPLERDQAEKALKELPVAESRSVFEARLPKLLFLQLISCGSKDSEVAGREGFLAASAEER